MEKNFILDEFSNIVTLHDEPDFVKMREAGKLASQVLDFIEPHIKIGVSTKELDKICHDFIILSFLLIVLPSLGIIYVGLMLIKD